MDRVYLLYDDGCKVCTTTRNLIARADSERRIEYVGLRSEQGRALAPHLDEETYWRSFHLVTGGVVRSGPDAFEEMLRLVPIARPVRRTMDKVPVARRGALTLYDMAVKLRGDLQCEHRAL